MKFSIAQQIDEVQYELKQRKNVYAKLDRTNPRGKSIREMHMARMRAVLETLEWLRRNEQWIKEFEVKLDE